MAISKKMRFDVFKRDGFACQYCGRTPPSVKLEVDHIVPVSKGGSDDPLNLVTSCFDCNRGKTNQELTVIPMALADQVADRMEREAQVKAYNRLLTARRSRVERDLHSAAKFWEENFSTEVDRDMRNSLRIFLRRLAAGEVIDAMTVVHEKHQWTPFPSGAALWRYFCGVCWTKIKRGGEAE